MLSSIRGQREVVCGDAVDWLENTDDLFKGSVFTAIPDVKDIPLFNSMTDVIKRGELYKIWFVSVAERIFSRLPTGQVAIFSQTDAKVTDSNGHVVTWIDKGHLCAMAAEKCGCNMLWHKITLDTAAPEGQYRPSFTHLICFGKRFTYHTTAFRTPDVLDRGMMSWNKATGLDACILGVAFLRNIVHTDIVISPFCGKGTILATANYFGLPSFGIEICAKRARASLSKNLSDVLSALPLAHLQKLGMTQDSRSCSVVMSDTTDVLSSVCDTIEGKDSLDDDIEKEEDVNQSV